MSRTKGSKPFTVFEGTRTRAGFATNNLGMPHALMPGNFGCRVVDGLMPSDLSDVYKPRRSPAVNTFAAVYSHHLVVPEIFEEPLAVDQLSDEESDAEPFSLPVPDLQALVDGFEEGDE